MIPSSGDNDKRHQFIEYSLCLHHSPRYHGVRPPDSRRWQWENDRSKSFVFPQIELLPPTTDRESRAAFLPPKIQLGAEKTFNVMMTATGKHHSRVINSWIWRATVFSWLAPVEWDIVGHLIRAEPVEERGVDVLGTSNQHRVWYIRLIDFLKIAWKHFGWKQLKKFQFTFSFNEAYIATLLFFCYICLTLN